MVRTSVFGWWTFPDLCLIYGTGYYFVGKQSAVGKPIKQANSAFHPSKVGK